MKRPSVWLLSTILAVISLVRANADTITLNSGEKLEGKILDETATELTIEVKVSAGVVDQKTITKSEIREMDRQTPDDAAYEQIKQVVPGAASLPAAADYDRIIETLNNFLKQFPASPHSADVSRAAQEFEAEKNRVAAGEHKFGGKWLNKEEFERQKPEIMAGQLYESMKNSSAAGDLVGALNALDQIEKKYAGTSIYPEAIELGRRVLLSLQSSVTQRMQKLQYDTAQWKQGVEITSEPKKSQLIAAYNSEQLRYDAAMAAEEKSGRKWKSLIPRSEKSLHALLTLIPTEATRLAAIDVAKIRRSIESATKAAKSIEANDLPAAESSLNEAKTLWPANASVVLLQAKLVQLKSKPAATQAPASGSQPEEQVAAAQKARAAAQAAQESAEPFYKTPMGALIIVLGAVLVVAAGSLLSRFVSKPGETPPKP